MFTRLFFFFSSRDEISSRQKRVNSKRHFTIDRDDFIPRQVSSRDEISRVNTLVFIKYLWNIWSCYLKFWFNRSLNHCIRFLHNYFDNLFQKEASKDHLTQGNLLKTTLFNKKQSNLKKEMYENISLYCQYFPPGTEVMFTKHTRNYEQDFLLDQKSYNIKTYTCNTTDWNVSHRRLFPVIIVYVRKIFATKRLRSLSTNIDEN